MSALSPQGLERLKKHSAARIGRGADRQVILLEICREAGMEWPQAEEFLEELEIDRRKTINRWRGLLLVLISSTLLVQTFMAAAPLYRLVFSVLEQLTKRPVHTITAALINHLAPYWPIVFLWLVLTLAAIVSLGSGLARLLHPD